MVSVPPTRVSVTGCLGSLMLTTELPDGGADEARGVRRFPATGSTPPVVGHSAGRGVEKDRSRRRSRSPTRNRGRRASAPSAGWRMIVCAGRYRPARAPHAAAPARRRAAPRRSRREGVKDRTSCRRGYRVNVKIILSVRVNRQLTVRCLSPWARRSYALGPMDEPGPQSESNRCRRPMRARAARASWRSTTSASTCRAARSSGCSAPTAPASRR